MNHYCKSIACSLAIGTCFALSTPASAATAAGNWYGGISGDFTWPNRADLGGGVNIDLGYRFTPGNMGAFRLEAEAGFHKADGEDGFGDLRYFDYMANVYYDFSTMRNWKWSSWHISPYVGAGAGLAQIRVGASDFLSAFRNNTNAFAYQGMAGLTFTSSEAPNTDWTIGYRYFGTEREEGIKVQANNLELGLRFHF